MKVVLLAPRRAGNPYRDEVWSWLQDWWERTVDLPLIEGTHLDGPFNRSKALNTAALLAGDFDVAVLIDADVMFDPGLLYAAVGVAVHTGGPVLAYTERIHLDKGGTRRILDGYRGDWRPFTRTQLFDSCSSAVVVTRDLWERVGGYDELFEGWGWEDIAFRIATETLSSKPLVKISGTCWHLWHPKSPENDANAPTFVANKERGARYKAARWDRERVRALVDEHRTARVSASGT